MIRSALARFMYGRNGTDHLGLFTLGLFLAVWLVQFFTRWIWLSGVELALMVITLFRMFSRNLPRRRAEDAAFLRIFRPIGRGLSHMRDREHRYFRCPNCGQQMRVPRGKGRIAVHCRACGADFEKKS